MGTKRDSREWSLGDHGPPYERRRKLQRTAFEKKGGENHFDEVVSTEVGKAEGDLCGGLPGGDLRSMLAVTAQGTA